MLSTQFVQTTRAPPRQQQVSDFQTLFLSLSGLSLGDKPSSDPGIVAAALFPPGDNVIFGHSTFFKQNSGQIDLPTPSAIRDAAVQGTHNVQTSGEGITTMPVPSLNLLVKYGPNVTITEAKCLLLLRRLLPQIPVPEVYGWRKDAGETFLYMSLPQGITLAEGWPLLSEDQKTDICNQLKDIIDSWRRLKQSSNHNAVANITNGPLHTSTFPSPAGPFSTVSSFHEWFVHTAMQASAAQHGSRVTSSYHFQPNSFFRDDTPIVFTHGALSLQNIVISTGPNPRIVSILDWSQAGWYPAYWEFCKARRMGGAIRDWEATYLPWVLDHGEFGVKKWGGMTLCHYWDYFVGLMERDG
ncbi:hypothetical protein OQA88_7202 [Cercophora sp. LCS_1]